jgi:hypothetical protein
MRVKVGAAVVLAVLSAFLAVVFTGDGQRFFIFMHHCITKLCFALRGVLFFKKKM